MRTCHCADKSLIFNFILTEYGIFKTEILPRDALISSVFTGLNGVQIINILLLLFNSGVYQVVI